MGFRNKQFIIVLSVSMVLIMGSCGSKTEAQNEEIISENPSEQENTIDNDLDTNEAEKEEQVDFTEDEPETDEFDVHPKEVLYFNQNYDLADDEVIIVDGSEFFNSADTIICDNGMKEIQRIEGYCPKGSVLVQSISTPVILVDAVTKKEGLYDLEKSEWILESDDIFLWQLDNGDFCYYFKTNQRDTPSYYIYNGDEFYNIGESLIYIDDYYWIQDDTGYTVKKNLSEEITHVNVDSACEINVTNGYPIITVSDEKGQVWAYSGEGKNLIEPEDLSGLYEYDEIESYTVEACTEEKGLLLLYIFDGEFEECMIFDIETKALFWPGDGAVECIRRDNAGHYAFLTTGEIGSYVFTDCLDALESKDGQHFCYVFGMDCYGYYDYETDTIIVESLDGELYYRMPDHESEDYFDKGTMIAKGITYISLYPDKLYGEIDQLGEIIYSTDHMHTINGELECVPEDYLEKNNEFMGIYTQEGFVIFNISTGEHTLTFSSKNSYSCDIHKNVVVIKGKDYSAFITPYGEMVMEILN